MRLITKGTISKNFIISDYAPLSQPLYDLRKIKPTNENILQIDGGGIKGLLPAYWLYVMELSAGRPLRTYFNTFWGTSTGAIIAALAVMGIPMKEALAFYIEKGPHVFQRNSILGLIGTKFSAVNLEIELKRLFPEDLTFESLYKKTKLNLNIVFVDARLRKTLVANHKRSPGMPLWKALRASSAAPYFFGPFCDKGIYFKEQQKEDNTYFDGGSGIFNNASEKAFNQAYYVRKIPAKKIFLFSLGTGKELRIYTPKDFRTMPGIEQLLWALSFGREESVNEQIDELSYLKKDFGLQYYRHNIVTPKNLDPMDNTNNIPSLLALVDTK